MKNILIIGYGVIGSHIHKEFPEADIYDIKFNTELKDYYDFAFIAVPSDMLEDGSCDISIVENSIQRFKDSVGVFIVKSTVPPGTTDYLSKTYSCNIVFSPEYYGVTPHSNDIPSMNFITIGGEKSCTNKVAQLYMAKHSAFFKINQTDAKTAELAKYMENCWLASQVTFANEFYRIAKSMGIDYIDLRELFICDSRVTPANTFVYEDHPYWDSHCFNKDIPALIRASEICGYDPLYMKAMLSVNKQFKRDS